MRPSRLLKLLPRTLGPDGYLNHQGAIFLISHMRGYTTLLSHLIGSHPEVAGYAEMHQSYHNALDLIGLAEKVEAAGAGAPQGRRLFDKILHTYKIRDAVLKRRDLSLLITVRHPWPTIASILKGRHGGLSSERDAGWYYLERLAQLRTIIERRAGRVLFIEAESLIEAPATTLQGISGYLGLKSGLASTYRSFPLTGKKRSGDSSSWIHSGKIERERDTNRLLSPSPYLNELAARYEAFRDFARSAAECSLPWNAPEPEVAVSSSPMPGQRRIQTSLLPVHA